MEESNGTNLLDSLPQGTGICTHCKGEVTPLELFGKSFIPEICKTCADEELQAQEDRELEDAHTLRYARRRIRKRFRDCTFETYRANGNRTLVDVCRVYADAFPPDNGRGLLLHGGPGTGKTHLSVAIARSIGGAVIVNCAELLDDIRATFKGPDSDLYVECKNAPLLVLDDMGKEKSSDWVWERLYILINYRDENMLPMVVTTNLAPIEFSLKWGQPIASRLHGMCELFEVKGQDWRRKPKD